MFRPGGGGGGRRMIQGIVARFREKGATSPDKAMTAQELGLPPRFEEAMHRRLGATGIFVEVNGKYYLDEAKLKQVQEQRRAGGGGGMGGMGGGWGPKGSVIGLRMARMVVGLAAVVLALSNILVVRSAYVSLAVAGLVVLWIALTVFQLFYLSRARSRWGASGMDGSGNTVATPVPKAEIVAQFCSTLPITSAPNATTGTSSSTSSTSLTSTATSTATTPNADFS